ncbi:phosphotransferase [Brachybacterium sp. JHP9]|uniref:Maltokinase n=1 Tax=Brachybacterium equifaecis TaxID=2910770 RepID=A0ABT0QXP4_9MICO|nr:phosphotransferase [Brachybacterium equifaecis]MCL6422443.1 phosphotransferase [Brachybacterium equifaecis]
MDRQRPASAALPDSAIEPLLVSALDAIAQWIPAQRWFTAKAGGAPRLELLAWAVLEAPADAPGAGGAEGALVVNTALRAGGTTDYQVPLVLVRRAAVGAGVEAEPGALIGEASDPSDPDAPSLQLVDAARSDLGRRTLLALLADGAGARPAAGAARADGAEAQPIADGAQPGTAGTQQSAEGGRALPSRDLRLQAAPVGDRAAGRVTRSRLLSGEQSNSSMIFDLEGRDPVILKLFRVLQEGENPDVVLQGALDAAGSTRIAPMVGSVRMVYGDARITTDSLLGQGFLAGVEDAWRVALEQAAAGADFTDGARTLGEATAEVHRILGEVLPSLPASPADAAAMVEQMLERLDQVAGQVAEVAQRREALAAVIRRAAQDAVAWPPMQRIHGDYHLGQVLQAPGRGWILLDFEGEPMRPLSQRVLPDCPVRDVAGMLRSFDYAGGAVALEHGADASAWVSHARDAFLAGYADASGIDPDDASFRTLIAAFEADKAVYEVLYEVSNRPDWLPIPLAALDRITGATQG